MSIQDLRLSPQDTYVLARWFVGYPVNSAPTTPLVARLVETLNPCKSEHLTLARSLFEHQIREIFTIDPNAEPPNPPAQQNSDYVPPLPKEAQFSDKYQQAAEGCGLWYRNTVDWLKQRSPMTPPHFLEAGAAWLIGLAANRRVCIQLHEPIYPTLYLLIVAETSKYAKSTGLRALHSLVEMAMPHMLIPGSTTTEGMLEIMSGQSPVNYDKLARRDQEHIEAGRRFAGQRGIILDEYSSLLGSIRKDYMHGFVELLMRLYDANREESHHTRSGGMIMIRYPALSILGATTPAAMARAITHEMWGNGAMARYLIMFRDGAMPYNPDYAPYIPPAELYAPLSALHKELPPITKGDILDNEPIDDFTPQFATVTKEAHKAYQAYTKAVYYDMLTDDLDERLHGNYRRMHVQAIKIALGLAAMDSISSGDRTITLQLGHWAIAQDLAEKARASLHRLMPVLSQSADSRTRKTIITTLMHYPAGLSISEIGDRTGRNHSEIRTALEALIESGQVDTEVVHPPRGRPATLYRFTDLNSG